MKRIILSLSVFSATFLVLLSYQNCGKGFNVSSGADLNLDESSLQYYEKNGFFVYGDQIFAEDPNSVSTNKNKSTAFGYYGSNKWPENKIYFDFESHNIPSDIRSSFIRACDEWSVGSNFSCEVANSDRIMSGESVLKISTDQAGCWSTVGYRSPRSQTLNLGVGCNNYGIILHELGHSIGFVHEHQRADRDNYIEMIEPDKLKPEWVGAIFLKFSENDLNYFKKPYDIDSIMHYTNYNSSLKVDGGKVFNVIANTSQIVPEPFQKTTLSMSDRTAVKELYGNSESQSGNYGEVRGWIDRVENGVIQGWACVENYQQIQVHVYAGAPSWGSSQLIAAGLANEESEPAVSAICKTRGIGHRFTIRLTPAQMREANNKAVYVYGLHPDPSGSRNSALNESGKHKIINTQGSQVAYSDIRGWIDRVENGVIQGWACVENYQQIGVHVYVGGSFLSGGKTFLVAAMANEESEPAVAAECKTSGLGHRFTIRLTPAQIIAANNKSVYVYGLHPDPSGSRNLPLQASGRYQIRSPGSEASSVAQGKKASELKEIAENKAKAAAEAQAKAKAAAEVKAKAAAEAQAKRVAEARAAAEAQAKKVAEAKAAAEVKAKAAAEAQAKKFSEARAAAEARAKAAAEARAKAAEVRAKAAAEAQAKRVAAAKAASEAQAKRIADAKSAAEAKAKAAAEAKAKAKASAGALPKQSK